jgi:hypothetical protein
MAGRDAQTAILAVLAVLEMKFEIEPIPHDTISHLIGKVNLHEWCGHPPRSVVLRGVSIDGDRMSAVVHVRSKAWTKVLQEGRIVTRSPALFAASAAFIEVRPLGPAYELRHSYTTVEAI